MTCSPYGKELLVWSIICFLYHVKKKYWSLNKGDVHNCRLYYKIHVEIYTRVCVHVVMMIRLTEGLFDKSRMKQPDVFEAIKSMNFMFLPSVPGVPSA